MPWWRKRTTYPGYEPERVTSKTDTADGERASAATVVSSTVAQPRNLAGLPFTKLPMRSRLLDTRMTTKGRVPL